MTTISNTKPGGIGLPGGPVVPGNGSVEVESKDWNAVKDHPVIAHHLKEGRLTVGKGKDGGEPEGEPQLSAFAVKETSPGWFVVTKDGADATKKLRKEDVEGFDEFSDADKAAFVEQNKAAA